MLHLQICSMFTDLTLFHYKETETIKRYYWETYNCLNYNYGTNFINVHRCVHDYYRLNFVQCLQTLHYFNKRKRRLIVLKDITEKHRTVLIMTSIFYFHVIYIFLLKLNFILFEDLTLQKSYIIQIKYSYFYSTSKVTMINNTQSILTNVLIHMYNIYIN